MPESARDAALKVIAEAFNTGHDPISPEFPQLEAAHRHDGHKFCSACWVCMGDAEKLTEHIADALAEAGLLRVLGRAPSGPPAEVLRQLADLADAGELDDFTLTRELTPDVYGGGWHSEYRVVNPAHPVTRIEIHHKPAPEGVQRA